MRLELGSPVHCTDDRCGELADVVIDPITRCVTHLVVQPHNRHGLARLVPVELAEAEDAAQPGITLRCTVEEVRRLAPVQEFAYLRIDEFLLDDPDWDIGVQDVLAQPYYDAFGFESDPVFQDPHVAMTYDRIPKGEVEIRRSSAVNSADGHHLGHVDGFIVDRDEHVTQLVLERGHLWGRREVTIPIAAVARVETDSIELTLSKDEVGALEPHPVHRWSA